ncbi:D-aminoacyl-tRNA deacylase [Marinobacter sp. M3C]|jgi:D-tyrosyl-tRNA(Tyr) deacylase|uniref:D-aminoacyl-tRNA deacylase n=1 Tax=unclassified Marinobacter TaxID=83889 RepID=UPI00200E4678|nr:MULTISPECIES: D-aminoacyl-tRNA deacylase [unclassified Marinobacter]MCL1476420.1 D-aminoacyl-tRNA deacylase [Marinobacter sp.]MCL1481017.1 D-aminoacyl-tRNA deacylase [Marinobacter sp.]MCL1483573.1 D-aminoacyl-tRNA deacylase [Marinobacter sp.]MCL1486673.1 D-aminoacyl-tRNA deacylase [Marinobacter sp.]UQG56786.1 D-aminoacyl-tRNA deacylase [Marinobacter sp. M4C]
MKALLQRVTHAKVTVNGNTIASIGRGVLLLLGIEQSDTPQQAKDLCRRTINYRIFPDQQGRMNLSLKSLGGGLLVVPQFTLAADTSNGARASFSKAAAPDGARKLYTQFVEEAFSALGEDKVGQGKFGVDMQVGLINDGPVTFLLQSKAV